MATTTYAPTTIPTLRRIIELSPPTQRQPIYNYSVSTAELQIIKAVEAAFSAGDNSALKGAYDAHGPLIYSYCRRAVGEHRAKDVTQEVFVSAWKAKDKFDSTKGSLAGWLMGIAKNRIVDNIRAEQRHTDRQSSRQPTDVPVEAAAEQVADRMLVADALKGLPERSRTIIELVYFQGLTHSQIADQTAIPIGTVKSDIHRGLATIRRHMESSHE